MKLCRCCRVKYQQVDAESILQPHKVSGSQLGPRVHCYFSNYGRKGFGTYMARGYMNFISCAEHCAMFFYKQLGVNNGGVHLKDLISHLNVVSTDSLECHLSLLIMAPSVLCWAWLLHPSLCVYITCLIPADTFC